MTKPATFDRRVFIRRGAMGAGAMWALSLGELIGRRAEAAIPSPYGPVSPKADENTGRLLLQVFEYDPRQETIKLIYDAPTFNDCDNPDNLTVTPRGGLILCEDNAGGQGQFSAGERLLGLTLNGGIFTFAINNVVLTAPYNQQIPAGDYRQNEWAGACYSPDGKWLFANIQTPGITFAITGPWGTGPL